MVITAIDVERQSWAVAVGLALALGGVEVQLVGNS
jgi:hypothetical protein